MRRYAIVLFLFLFLSSCIENHLTYQDKLAPWVGQDSYALFETWGKPNQVFPINATDYAWVYIKTGLKPHQKLYQNVFAYDGWQEPKYGQPEVESTYYCKTYFTIRHGLIINYSYNGDDCS